VSEETHSQPDAPTQDPGPAAGDGQRPAGPADGGTDGVADPDRSLGSPAVVEQARADIAAGREWRARERLAAHLADRYDPEALELLGEVHHAMRDLPAAGAAWFGTNRRGADVDEAIAAWRERHGDDFPQMWRSLPRLVRDHEGNKRVDALRRRAEQAQPVPATPVAPVETADSGGGMDAAVVIALVLAGLFVVFAVIGFIWVITWLVP